MLKIDFLYFEECPSHEAALDRLESVMAQLGIHEEVRVIKVDSEQAANEMQFVGSPTIRINGVDIVPSPPDETFRLACRIYHLEDGRVSPLPSENTIRNGLKRGIQSKF